MGKRQLKMTHRKEKMASSPHVVRSTRFLLGTAIAVGTLLSIGSSHVLGSETMPAPSSVQSLNVDQQSSKYLGFQVFIGESVPTVALGSSQAMWTQKNAASGAVGSVPLSRPPGKDVLASFAQGIIDKIGNTGQGDRKLSLIFGPLAFDQTDEDIDRVVKDIFDIAIEKNVAVGFHIDDSKFWSRRKDLWQNPGNVEWLDWDGTPSRGMFLGWGEPPPKLAPPMCFNSRPIVSEVRRLGRDVIGRAIKRGIDRLAALGRPELFSGVIMGWETSIGRDHENNKVPLGYCALTNLGFSKTNAPKNLDAELESVVHDFIQLWAKSLVDAGISKTKIFGHVAYLDPAILPVALKNAHLPPNLTYSEVMGFAPLKVTFNDAYLSPGFSYYGDNITGLYDQMQSAGIARWASSEGANVGPRMTMEAYLGSIFNHGGVLANIFGWGLGPDDPRNPFRYAAERPSALHAYNKFLSGAALVGGPSPSSDPSSNRLDPCPNPLPSDAPSSLSGGCQQLQTVERAGAINYPLGPFTSVGALNATLAAQIASGHYSDAENIIHAVLNAAGR